MFHFSEEFIINRLKEQTIIYPDTNCWLWQGEINHDGYGQIWAEGKRYTIHRLIAHFYWGLNLEDKTQLALHIQECANKNCWNPAHLYVGSQSDNRTDMYASGRIIHHNTKKTHCKYGHEYTEENTRILGSGSRVCIQCEKLRGTKRRLT